MTDERGQRLGQKREYGRQMTEERRLKTKCRTKNRVQDRRQREVWLILI